MLVPGLSQLSETSKRFSIPNLETARQYLLHLKLGNNLIDDLTNLNRIFKLPKDITNFFNNSADIPKFISCILLFYVAVKSGSNRFRRPKYRIFDSILINLIKKKNLDNLNENLTIKTIFEGYPKINEIIDKQTLDIHIERRFYQPPP